MKRSQTTQSPRSSAGRIEILEMDAPRGEHQQRLRHGRHALLPPLEHDLPHALGERRAAGLAGQTSRGIAAALQPVAHRSRDGGFAGALDALERDEQSRAHRCPAAAGGVARLLLLAQAREIDPQLRVVLRKRLREMMTALPRRDEVKLVRLLGMGDRLCRRRQSPDCRAELGGGDARLGRGGYPHVPDAKPAGHRSALVEAHRIDRGVYTQMVAGQVQRCAGNAMPSAARRWVNDGDETGRDGYFCFFFSSSISSAISSRASAASLNESPAFFIFSISSSIRWFHGLLGPDNWR